MEEGIIDLTDTPPAKSQKTNVAQSPSSKSVVTEPITPSKRPAPVVTKKIQSDDDEILSCVTRSKYVTIFISHRNVRLRKSIKKYRIYSIVENN
jgi:hypothetical protein